MDASLEEMWKRFRPSHVEKGVISIKSEVAFSQQQTQYQEISW